MKAEAPSFCCSPFRFLAVLATLLVLLLIPRSCIAQDTASISGTVSDKSGSAVAGAQIVVTATGGNVTRNTESNSDGAFVAAALPPGTYDLVVTAPGFQKFTAKTLKVDVGQKLRVDVPLTVGSVTEEVVVTGENVAQVDTQTAEIGSTITGKQVNELVLNGRNFTQLVTTVPGVVSQTGQDEGTVGIKGNVSYSFNGGRTEYNNWELDGGDNMDNGSNATLNVYPNLDAIAEFKVLTSNYGAQYGKNGSGTVEVETKSGTNQFHGSAFYYGRNEAFNANSWENNGQGVARPAYKKHDWGYTIGGPVFIPHVYNTDKKKTFFFWSQEWRREIVPGGTITQAVPSAAELGGNFNDVCFNSGAFYRTNPVDSNNNSLLPAGAQFAPDCPSAALGPVYTAPNGTQIQSYLPYANNQVPVLNSTTVAALKTLIPAANNTSGAGGTYTGGPNAGNSIPAYVANPSYPTHWREELIRVDQNLTDNERLTFRYIHDTWGTVQQGPLWNIYPNSFDNTNTNFTGPTTSFVAKLASNISPTLLNEFVASYTADHIFLTELGNVSLPQGGIDLNPLFPAQFIAANKIPAFSVGNTNGNAYGSAGFGVDTGYFPWKNANPTYTVRDIVTNIIGNHTLYFGGYLVIAQKNQQSSQDIQGQLTYATSNPNSTGNPLADLLTGQIGSYTQNSAQPYFYDRYKIFEWFIQDDYRITRKLTLNLGLRWSLFGRYQEKYDQEFGFAPQYYLASAAPTLYPFNDPNGNAQLLQPNTGNPFNGYIQCGAANSTYQGIGGGPTGCLNNKYANPGPRLGFAYDPFGNGKWAIRGGYGIFFEHMNGNETNAEVLQEGPSPLVLNGSVANITGYPNVSGGTVGAAAPINPYSIPLQVQWPYMQQWNFGIQHELPAHFVVGAAYVGSKGTHLTRQLDLNQLHPVPASQNPYLATGSPITAADCSSSTFNYDSTGLPTGGTLPSGATLTPQAAINLFVACGNAAADYYRPYPGYGTITRIENTANSIYNALQLTARRTFGDLSLTASYNYSHSIDDSSDRGDGLFVDSYDLARQRASSTFDIRQAFSISYVYNLPFFRNSHGFTKTALAGWQLSGITIAQTGVPFTATNSTTYSDNAGVGNGVGTASYPDLIGNPYNIPADVQQAFHANGPFGKLLLNPTAFGIPTGLTFGNTNRNEFRMPGRFNSDFGLFKEFSFGERYALQFRWENFNVFNHTQLDALGGNISSGGTGLASSMGCNPSANLASGGDPSCGGFLVLNGSHLPRIMQFGLRFQF